MARDKVKYIPSLENLDIEEIANHYNDLNFSLNQSFIVTKHVPSDYFGFTIAELLGVYNKRLDEIEIQSVFSLLSSLEASFRIDYYERVKQNKKDNLSKELKSIYNRKKEKAKLDEDILNAWKTHTQEVELISDLKGIFKYRHWVAHGRYWKAQFPRRINYLDIYAFSERLYNTFDFLDSK